MNKITAIIVDDEKSSRENLNLLLNSFCKDVELIGEASNVDDAVLLINKKNPQIVFLDIEMPEKNGFQLLNEFNVISFKIIFVTAYNSFAIKAFQVSALDYLLKPVEIDLLKQAVEKAKKQLGFHLESKKLEILKENTNKLTKIAVPYQKDFVILNIEDITCIEADRMYSIIYTSEDKKYVSAKKLQYYEKILAQNNFMRVHRSWLINTKLITLYSKKEKFIELTQLKKVPVSKGFKDAFEAHFKM